MTVTRVDSISHVLVIKKTQWPIVFLYARIGLFKRPFAKTSAYFFVLKVKLLMQILKVELLLHLNKC